MKKRFTAVFTALALSAVSLSAQGYPVIDMANLFESMENVYALYSEISNTIEQVQNQYKQIEAQVKSVASIDWSAVAADAGSSFTDVAKISAAFTNPNVFQTLSDKQKIMGLRTSLIESNKKISGQLDKFNQLEDTINKKTVTFGGKSYTIGGLYGFSNPGNGADEDTTFFDIIPNVQKRIQKSVQKEIDNYTKTTPLAEQQAIAQKYGVSSANMFKLRLLAEQRTSLTEQMVHAGMDESKKAEETETVNQNNAAQVIMDDSKDSMAKKLEASFAVSQAQNKALNTLSGKADNIQAFMAQKQVAEDAKAEAEAEAKQQQAANDKQLGKDNSSSTARGADLR